MRGFRTLSLLPAPLIGGMLLLAITLLVPSYARSEIVVDDFDEPFEFLLPEMQDQPFTVFEQSQSDIGPLRAERRSNFLALESKPTGRLDADVSRDSSFNIDINRLRPTDHAALLAGASLNYYFDETDITQNGKNDRIAVDFAYLRSAIPLPRVSVGIKYAETVTISPSPGRGINGPAQAVTVEIRNYAIGELLDVPTRDGPFVLEFPFDATQFDPTRARGLYFSISPAYFTDVDEVNFSAAIDRIRITVPEPSTIMNILAFAAGWSATTRRCFRHRGVRQRRTIGTARPES